MIDKRCAECKKRMESMKETRLLRGKSKVIEQQIVSFYVTIGKMDGLNARQTEVFSYLKIYDALSQEQLKQLTGFSLSTISSILQSFLQADIVRRTMIPGTHKNLYRIMQDRVKFTYRPPTQIIDNLEKLDLYIVSKQGEIQELRSKYPIATKFIHRRLNSLRNYVEVQRRSINREKRFSFFQEDVSEFIPLNELIIFPFETRELENEIMDILRYYKRNPIGNRILSVFITHRSLDQDTLVEKTGFSRSAISRYLRNALKGAYIRVLPREYRKPQVYFLESMALSILSLVLKADNFIFSNIPKFQEIRKMLQSGWEGHSSRNDITLLVEKCEEIIKHIKEFRNDTRYLRQAHKDLLEFLGKEAQSDASPQ